MMLFDSLRAIAFAVWAAIHPLAPRAPDAPAIADGIAAAVESDDAEPLTGSRVGDAALAALYAYRESGLRRCAVGDQGRSLGAWQLQRTPAAVACDPVQAAPRWLRMAHGSLEACAGRVPAAEGLAALVSGSCGRGRRLARWRWEQAAQLALPFLEGSAP